MVWDKLKLPFFAMRVCLPTRWVQEPGNGSMHAGGASMIGGSKSIAHALEGLRPVQLNTPALNRTVRDCVFGSAGFEDTFGHDFGNWSFNADFGMLTPGMRNSA